MKRFFDITLALVALFILAFPMFIIAVAIKIFSPGSIFYYSDRIGQNNIIFSMPKFRSMRIDTPQLPTHLFAESQNWITPIGKFLRKTSLDELPQLWSILTGRMSFVGPRPALFNQEDLIAARTEKSIHKLVPGLTGWAQVNGRDEISIKEKVAFDKYYLDHCSLLLDIKIILLTFIKVVRSDGIKQADQRRN